MSADQGQLYDDVVVVVVPCGRNQLDEFKKLGHQNLTKDWTCVNDEFDTRQANVIGSFPLCLKALSRPILSDHPLMYHADVPLWTGRAGALIMAWAWSIIAFGVGSLLYTLLN